VALRKIERVLVGEREIWTSEGVRWVVSRQVVKDVEVMGRWAVVSCEKTVERRKSRTCCARGILKL